MTSTYYAPHGGHPAQTELLTDRAMFTEAYAVLPRGTMRDIVTSKLPFWDNTRLWVLARPLSGFAETFSQYVVEVAPGGGSDRPEPPRRCTGRTSRRNRRAAGRSPTTGCRPRTAGSWSRCRASPRAAAPRTPR